MSAEEPEKTGKMFEGGEDSSEELDTPEGKTRPRKVLRPLEKKI